MLTLRDVEYAKQQGDFDFGRVILTGYYFQNFVAYALGGVIAALIGFILLMLNRHPVVTKNS